MNPDLHDLKQKALAIRQRLCAPYDCPIPYFHLDLCPAGQGFLVEKRMTALQDGTQAQAP